MGISILTGVIGREGVVRCLLFVVRGVFPTHFFANNEQRTTNNELKTLLVSAAALIDTEGRVLLAQRPAGKPMAGLWEFPGGKVEEGETPEQTLIRELEEELGIETAVGCLQPIAFVSHCYYKSPPPSVPQITGLCPGDASRSHAPDITQDFHLLMLCYAIRKWNGIPAAHEGQVLTWRRPKDMRDLLMPAADVPVVRALMELL